MTATGATVIIIQGFLGFLEGQTSAEYGIDSGAIERISNYMIRLRLMLYASAGIPRQLKSKGIILKIDDDITVPRIEGANQEK